MLELAKAEGKSIGDLSLQLDYIWKELSEGYGKLLKTLQATTSVIEASTAVLTQYERPADMGEAVQAKRAGYAQTYFDKYAPSPPILSDLRRVTTVSVRSGRTRSPSWVHTVC